MRSSSACSAAPLCVASGVTDGTTTIDSPGWLSRMRRPRRGTSRCWSRAKRALRSSLAEVAQARRGLDDLGHARARASSSPTTL